MSRRALFMPVRSRTRAHSAHEVAGDDWATHARHAASPAPAGPALLQAAQQGGRGTAAARQAAITQLQRTVGNRAAARLLRPGTSPAPVAVQRVPAVATVTATDGAGLHKSNSKKSGDKAVKVRKGGLFGTGVKDQIPKGAKIVVDPDIAVTDDKYTWAAHVGRQGFVKKAHLAIGKKIVNPDIYKTWEEAILATEDPLAAAAKYSGDRGIRRGNRLGSIRGTGGMSNAMLGFMRSKVRDSDANYLLSRITSALQEKKISTEGLDLGRIRAHVADLLQVGNCGEFSNLIFYRLMETSEGHWIYKMAMVATKEDEHYDHAFNITSDAKVTSPKQFDPDKAMVIDAWNNYQVAPLRIFLGGANPYGEELTLDNIAIRKVGKTVGKTMLPDDVKQVINDVVVEEYTLAREKIQEGARRRLERIDKLGGVFDFDRSDREVSDLR